MTILIGLGLLALLAVVGGLLYAVLGLVSDVRAAALRAERWLESIDRREAEENAQRAQRITEFLAAKGSGRELLKARLAQRLAGVEAKP